MDRRFANSALDGSRAGELTVTRGGPTSAWGAERPRPPYRAADTSVRRTSTAHLPTVTLQGVRLHAITEQQCVDHILAQLEQNVGGVVVTPNLDHLRRCTRDLTFGALVAEADLVVADGMPLVWASRLQRTPLPQRVAGSDMISSLSAAAARRGHSIYLLGGVPGTADAAAKVLRDANPSLRIVGTHCPPFGFEADEQALNDIAAALVASQPDIVFVALGSPKQEYLIERLRNILPHAWWLGVGVSFSFLCGDVKRAPRWMQRTGLEWIHRLVQEPKRLFHRYVVVGIPFGLSLLSASAMKGLLRKAPRAPMTMPPSLLTPVDGQSNGNGHATAKVDAAPVSPSPRRTQRRPRDEQLSVPGASAAAPKNLHRLRAMVLLGGAVRQSTLTTATGRSVLDLPLDESGSILNHWLAHASDLAQHAGLAKLPVRVLVNHNSPEPVSIAPRYYGTCQVERDLSEYRGTGGVLRDLATEYDDEDLILVANAAQVLLDPLAAIATALDRKLGDIAIVGHADGTPSGVMLITCKTLRLISDTGYVDMKEQALPAIAARYDARVMYRRRPTGVPIRSLADYVQALRAYHRRAGVRAAASPQPVDAGGAEDFSPAFRLIEPGAQVDPRAHVHDAVVLRGGVVEAGAAVVRSLVCAGGAVRRDRTAVDQLVYAAM